MVGIYKITSPTGRIYIGQSIDIEKRFAYYRSLACKTQPKLYRSLLKYGFENHKLEVVITCDIYQLTKNERLYQEKFNTIINGLNCVLVGTNEFRAVISEETKKKIGDFNRGVKRPKEICEKISKARKGMIFSDAHKDNIRKSKTGQNNKRSKIVLDLSTGIYYDCIQEASLIYSIDNRTLSRYLNGTRRNKTNLISV